MKSLILALQENLIVLAQLEGNLPETINLKRYMYLSAGYYARVKGMRMLLDQFLSQTSCNCQIINLGAGFDSLFWLLKVTVTYNWQHSLLNCFSGTMNLKQSQGFTFFLLVFTTYTSS